MATSKTLIDVTSIENQEESLSPECKQLLPSLPREKGHFSPYVYQYQNFWYPPKLLEGVLHFQKFFGARDDDLFLATLPKSGTTWLKALAFAIVNRSRYDYAQHPLLTNSPHDLVRFVETLGVPQISHSNSLASPRLLATHVPYSSLPDSVKDSGSRIVYLCRNPRDNFISWWKFSNKVRPKYLEPLSLEEAFELFCIIGSFWDHALEYWNESLERPEKVLFVKYEEMKGDTIGSLKRLADFLGNPFSLEEEREGKVEEMSRLCSFEKLSNLDVTKTGKSQLGVENSSE